jgi:hypothetical protein
MADKKISQLTAAATPLAGTEVLPIVQGGSTVKVSVDNLTAGKAVSASGLTLTGGTAKGVLYLSDPGKAATSSTDFVYTATGVGIGNPTPAHKLDLIQDANAFSGIRVRNNDAGSSAYAGVIVNASGNSWAIRMGSGAANSNGLQFALDALGTPVPLLTLNTVGNLVPTAGKGIDFSANGGDVLTQYNQGTWTPADASGAGLTFTNNGAAFTQIGNVVTINMEIVWPVTADGSAAKVTLPFAPAAGTRAAVGAMSNAGVVNFYIPGSINAALYNNAGATISNATMSGKYLMVSISYLL